MATIKSYTDLSQSKTLSKILPLESADMRYISFRHRDDTIEWVPQLGTPSKYDFPCWTLAALLSVLPFPVLYMEMLGGMILWCCEGHLMETDEVVKIEHYNNPVDACYDMILKLHELNLL